MRLALTTPFQGHHTLFIVDSHNTLGYPADLLARLLYPQVPCQTERIGDQSLVDWRQTAGLLSFESQIPATSVMET